MLKYLLSVLVVFFVVGNLSAQKSISTRWVELPSKNMKVEDILKNVFPVYEVELSYSDDLMPMDKPLSFDRRQIRMDRLLNRICKNENLAWEEVNGSILFRFYDRPDSDYVHTISGKIREKGSNEPLIGAYLQSSELGKGAVSNAYGFYSLTLPRGKYKLFAHFVGYNKTDVEIDLNRNIIINFYLEENTRELANITIESKSELDLAYKNTLTSVNRINMDMAGDIPYFLGEVDVFQSSLLLPGITNVGEGTAGLNIRGGSSDQNLILMDEALVYNSSHFYGLTSIFNPDAVSDVEIYKGSFPVNYGGRISSVMHIRQRDGNNETFHASGGLGLITSRLLVEGPLQKNKSSFLISGRTTFWDFLTREAENPTISGSRANFRDFNTKLNFDVGSKNKIHFSGYIGQDENKFGIDQLRKWGNRVFSLRWNRIHNDRLFSNHTAYMSSYRYRVIEEDASAAFVGTSRITDYTIKSEFTYFQSPENIYSYGGSITYHRLVPGTRIPGVSSSINEVDLGKEGAIETSAHVSYEKELSNQLTATAGLRISHFANVGPGDEFVYEQGVTKSVGSIVDTLIYGNGEISKAFFNLEPRGTLTYQIDPNSSAKFNYSRSVQYLHLLSNTVTSASSDIWKASSKYIPPSVGHQFTLGYYTIFKPQDLEASVEFFYRKNENVIEYKGGADLLFNPAIEAELLAGQSRSFGLEVFLKKDIGHLTGWVGYTLSKAQVQVDGTYDVEKINNGEYFLTNFDRPHSVSISTIYRLNKRWTLSSNFIYQTGRPFSFPIGKYKFDGYTIPHYEERNANRLPPYHRLDISARLESRQVKKNGKKRRNRGNWVFSIYNVYNRRNTQTYIFQENEENPEETEVLKYSLLGAFIPSATYNFKF